MNKIIKFRQARFIDGKIKWHYWGFIDGEFISRILPDIVHDKGILFYSQQFTGKKDKNGKEIYEEDVVKMENGEIGKVVYEGCCFVLKRKDPQKYISWADEFFEDCEIIGNIYDNPIKP